MIQKLLCSMGLHKWEPWKHLPEVGLFERRCALGCRVSFGGMRWPVVQQREDGTWPPPHVVEAFRASERAADRTGVGL